MITGNTQIKLVNSDITLTVSPVPDGSLFKSLDDTTT